MSLFCTNQLVHFSNVSAPVYVHEMNGTGDGGPTASNQTERFLKTDLKDPATSGIEAAKLETVPCFFDGISGGMELRPISEPNMRLMVKTERLR